MSTTQPPPKKLRKRSKSFFKENSPSTDAELAPDLNGDDAAAKPKTEPETDVPAAPKDDKDKSESNDAPNTGRKRKASEIKDNSLTETSDSVDDKDKDKSETLAETPPESEAKPEVKEEDKGKDITMNFYFFNLFAAKNYIHVVNEMIYAILSVTFLSVRLHLLETSVCLTVGMGNACRLFLSNGFCKSNDDSHTYIEFKYLHCIISTAYLSGTVNNTRNNLRGICV